MSNVILEYDLTGLIPFLNDFLVFKPLRKIVPKNALWKLSTSTFLKLRHKYIPVEKDLEKTYLKVKSRKKTSANSYGGRVASLMQSYYLNHLRKVYIPGNTNWTKGYHKKLRYKRALSNILIDVEISPRKSINVGVISDKKLSEITNTGNK